MRRDLFKFCLGMSRPIEYQKLNQILLINLISFVLIKNTVNQVIVVKLS